MSSPSFRIRTLAATLTAGLALACVALPGTAGAVVDGMAVGVANDGDYPWTVAVTTRGVPASQGQFCGGTIISQTHILTAAHCIIDETSTNVASPDSIDVLVGQTSLSAPGGDIGGPTGYRPVSHAIHVQSISLHPQAETSHFRYDVAILTLAEPVDAIDPRLDAAIVAPVDVGGGTDAGNQLGQTDPIPLTDKYRLLGETPNPGAWGPGTDGFVFGWGTTTAGGAAPNVLRFVGGKDLERLADPICASRYGGAFSADDMLCAGEQDPATPGLVPDACQGDSGGPLLKRATKQKFFDSMVDDYKNSPSHPTDTQVSAFIQSLQGEQVDDYAENGANWRLMGVVSFGEGCGSAAKPGVYARVGAASIHDFVVQTNPQPMPSVDLTQPPSVSGSFGVGQAITCNPGSWSHASSFDFQMWRDTNNDGKRGTKELALGGPTSTGRYLVQPVDLTTSPGPVGCTVTARGAGGYAVATAKSVTLPVVQSGPVGVTPQTPAATTPATVADKVGPTISRSSAVCAATSCRLAVVILDPDHGVAGVATAKFTVTITRRVFARGKDGKLHAKTVKIRRGVRAKRSGDQWVVLIKSLHRSDKLSVAVTALDQSGNTGSLKIPLALRSKHS